MDRDETARLIKQFEDEYLIKNNWEDLWLKAGKPSILNNPTFDEVLTIVKGL